MSVVRFEVLSVVAIRNTARWDVTLHSLSTLKTEAAHFSET